MCLWVRKPVPVCVIIVSDLMCTLMWNIANLAFYVSAGAVQFFFSFLFVIILGAAHGRGSLSDI